MKYTEIRNFSGGEADSNYQGVVGSFGTGSTGLDIHSTVGLLKSNFKLTKDSGSTVTDLILWAFVGSDSKTYFFGDGGKCYVRATNGSWSSPKNFSERICGAYEYNSYIYVATDDTLYRVAKATGTYDLSGLASYQTWTGTEIDASWHPMAVSPAGNLVIGAGRYVSQVDSAGNWSAEALDLPPDWVIKCFGFMGDNLLVGASNTIFSQSAIYTWDGISDSWQTPVRCPESIINTILSDGRNILVQAGTFGNIYQFTGYDFVKIRQLYGSYSSSAYMTAHPQASCFYYGSCLFGVSNGSGNPLAECVYQLGRYGINYPLATNKAFVISTTRTSGVDIGCIVQNGTSFFVSWKDTTGSTTYGVDIIDTNKANGVYETVILGGNSSLPEGTMFTGVIVNCEPLPSGTSIALKYRKNGGSTWLPSSDEETYSTTSGTSYAFRQGFPIEAKTVEFQFTLTSSTTNTPKINSILIEYNG